MELTCRGEAIYYAKALYPFKVRHHPTSPITLPEYFYKKNTLTFCEGKKRKMFLLHCSCRNKSIVLNHLIVRMNINSSSDVPNICNVLYYDLHLAIILKIQVFILFGITAYLFFISVIVMIKKIKSSSNN